MGKIDHWVTRPVQSPDEEFHESITRFLGEWGSLQGGGFEAVQVIGEHWSARSQELRDTFSRNGIPIGFYDAGSAAGPADAPRAAAGRQLNCRSWSSASVDSSQRWPTRRTWRSPRLSA